MARMTQTEIVNALADKSGLKKTEVKSLFDEIAALATAEVKKNGEFTLPGLFKVSAIQVPATKKRFGKNPFTGLDQWFAAKPASVKVKVRPLKKLKDAAL